MLIRIWNSLYETCKQYGVGAVIIEQAVVGGLQETYFVVSQLTAFFWYIRYGAAVFLLGDANEVVVCLNGNSLALAGASKPSLK
jgi:hypothetical protein